MSEFIIYGKRPNHKKFAPLDAEGHRVKKSKAMSYATVEDAQSIIDRAHSEHPETEKNEFEIRKA